MPGIEARMRQDGAARVIHTGQNLAAIAEAVDRSIDLDNATHGCPPARFAQFERTKEIVKNG
jgi:coenzyme F420-reducing hydrogenase gamma subunit